jgi:hypothetical protein
MRPRGLLRIGPTTPWRQLWRWWCSAFRSWPFSSGKPKRMGRLEGWRYATKHSMGG